MSDLIAEELRKKPHSIVFLENVDKADYGVQHSLDVAIRTEEQEHKVPRSCLDLNFPVDVGDDDDPGLGQSKSKKEALEDWISKVVGGSLAEAGQKYNLTPQSVVKLVACEGGVVKEEAPGIRLPAKVNLN
ncbi:hypothetical protein F3Y22_tig00003715pilonHSYRG00133 [Hibiscus syriacus]|uniref:SMAX1-like AAA+ ATPase lid domain-containing protein n=1 Tax=Hibiscus syriacus TaxID=106335 RepID=A0A6A3CQJ7_HIBSY|nr:hypothetical protein F3Y22_tig00003715pilonHSYRG00133 [Hibiscus syriacus]